MSNPVKIPCLVHSLQKVGGDTYSVELEPRGRVPRFKAGQFLHLTLDGYDPAGGFWPESRVFSIASRSGAGTITIVYSVKGRYTKRMEEELRPGREVWIKLPFGDFIIDSRIGPESDIVLVAGGTGLSPFIPFLEERLERGRGPRAIRLYYGLRSPSLLLFGELLGKCQEAGIADLQVWLESGMLDDASGPLAGRSRPGRLSPGAVRAECAGLADPVFFLSGPPAMIETFRTSLEGEGLDPARIQIDSWE